MKNGRYIIMKRQKIFDVLIGKRVVKIRILGNASLMTFLAHWIHPFFNFSCPTHADIFPYTTLNTEFAVKNLRQSNYQAHVSLTYCT